MRKLLFIMILLLIATQAKAANFADTDQFYMWDGTQYWPTVSTYKTWMETLFYTESEIDTALGLKQDTSSLETDVEAVVDLQDLQGAVTDAQVPDDITITETDPTAEPALGNPASDGYVLSSTSAGVRTWVENSGSGSTELDALTDVTGEGTTDYMLYDDGDGTYSFRAAPSGSFPGFDTLQSDYGFDPATKQDAMGADDNYVTDAEKVVIGNTSGVNTGDFDFAADHTYTGINTFSGTANFSGTLNMPENTTLPPDSVGAAELEDADLGDISVSGGVITVEAGDVDTAALATTATTANSGDSATAFFSTGTIEDARIPSTIARDSEVTVTANSGTVEIYVLDDCTTATGMSTGDLCFEY